MKKTLRRIKKVLLVLTGILLFLMLLVYLFFKVPAIQNKVADKVTGIASNSLNTEVRLGEILIIPPNKVEVKDLYVQGVDGDSLLSAGTISANVNLFKLLSRRIEINQFTLSDALIAIRKDATDSTFNFAFNTDTSSKEPDTTEKTAWTFDIDEVELNQVNAGFADELSGNNYKASIGYLNLSLDSLNLEETAFYVETIDFSDADILVDIHSASEEESDEGAALPMFAVSEDIQLENINLKFNNLPSSQWLTLEHLSLTVVPEKIDLLNNLIAFEEISLHNSFIKLKDLSQDTVAQPNPQNPEGEALPWEIAVNAIDFENNSLEYIATESPQSGYQHFNADNIKVSKLSADINNAYFRDGNAGAEIAQFSFREHDQFYLKSFRGNFALTESGVEAKNVRIMTSKSEIAFSLNTGPFDPEQLSNTYPQVPFQLKLKDVRVNYDDVQYFYQDTALAPYRDAINQLAVNARLDGAINDLQIKEFNALFGDEMITRIEGRVAGLPEVKSASGNLMVTSRLPDSNTIMQYLPESLLPENVRIPENLLVEADISGDYLAAKGKLRLSSKAGDLKADLDFEQDTNQQKETFKMALNAEGFDLGAVYPMGDTLGKLFANVTVSGQSSGFKNPAVDAELQVDTLHLLDYPYSGLNLKGSYADNKYSAEGSIDDENIVFSFDGDVDLTDTIPDIQFVFDMPGADFQALNLASQDFRAGLKVRSDINGNSPDNSNGHLAVKDIVLVKQNQRYEFDSVVFQARNEKDLTHLTANSKLFDIDFEGNVKFSDISKSLWSHLNLFFRMDSIPVARPDLPKRFNLNLAVNDHPLIRELFFPDLTTFGGFNLEVAYNQANSLLNVNSLLSPMAYNGIELDSTRLQVESEGEELKASLVSEGIERQPVFIPDLALKARVSNNVANWNFEIKDLAGEKKYAIAGKVLSEDAAYKSVLNADSLKMNYAQWNIPEQNAVLLYKDSIAVHDFHLTKGKASVQLKQEYEQGQDYTRVVFDAFRLKTLTNMVTVQDMADADVNGYFSFSKADTSLRSELTVNNLTLEGRPLFQKVTLDFDRDSETITAMTATLSQSEGGAEIQGRLVTDENSASKATISFNKFTLDNFQPFFKEDLQKLYGNINGELEVSDPAGDMEINGSLAFDNAVVAPKMLGTSFGIDGSALAFEKNSVVLKQFTINDAYDHKATLDGEVSALFSPNIRFDIDFNSDNYTFLNADEGDNDMFYGNLTGDISAEIYGSVEQPQVELNTQIKTPSDFHFIVPSSENATVEREGVVVFVKEKDETFSEILEVPEDTTDLEFSPGFDLDMTARISVDNDARLTIIVDPASDEQLSIQGTADLNFNMTDGAQQTLTGRYLINEGKYTMTLYDVVKREFEISENSSITWTGDVMDAQADLSAVYQVRTSAEGLIANEVSDMSEDKRQQLSQPYPFMVTLNISGELLQPTLDFDISLPRNVSMPEITNKLNQINQNESEVNKQAFSLLVFGSFIQNNVSTSRPISYEINSAARSSISKILSTQLNRLAEKYIKGVDVNLKVDSYADYSGNSTRNTTNVKLDVRKQFFDERLTVKVGGKVNIEGEEQRSENLQRVAGDVVILYDLTEDGRFKLKGFNTTEYENMFEGELRKTGVGIIYNRDYYHLRNLFQADSLDRRRKSSDNDLIVE